MLRCKCSTQCDTCKEIDLDEFKAKLTAIVKTSEILRDLRQAEDPHDDFNDLYDNLIAELEALVSS